MPTYIFQGRNSAGKLMTGKRSAPSAEIISSQLIKEGTTPISIKLSVDKEASSLEKRLQKFFKINTISREELSVFARQMYILSKSGVPLTQSIKQLSSTSRSPRMSTVLLQLSANLEAGQDLVQSMSRYPDIFTPFMISMMRVGQSSGRFDDAFLRLNQYLEFEEMTSKRFKTATRYPMFVLTAIVGGIIIVNIFVIPTFAKVYAKSNMELPYITTVLINISYYFVNYWYYVIAALMFISYIIYKRLQTFAGRLAWDKRQLKLPIVGSILKRITLLRFAQTFGITVNAGIPVIEGLHLVAQSIDNTYARSEINAMQDAIQHGNTLTQAARNRDLFTPLELQMLAVSEETGELGLMLEQISLFYQREVEYDLRRLNDMIEPITLIALSVMVLMLALAIYLPIWNMVKLAH